MPERLRNEFDLAWLVAWRELRDQLRDWRIIFPMVILTVVLPFLANLGAQAAVDFTTQYGTPLIAERLVPFLLLVVGFFPITVSLVIALESFVGEKERGTIEPLLASPLKDWQIYMGKLIAGTATPLFTAYLGIGVYLVGLFLRHIPIPDANRMAQTLILTTVQALLMVSAAILISTQATSVRASSLMASFIVIPMGLLIQGESVMLFWGNDQALWLAVVGVAILTLLLVRVGIAHFQREALLGREIDILNLRWIGKTFWKAFIGQARSPQEWWVREVWGTIRRQSTAIWTTLLLGILAAVGGYVWVTVNSTQILASLPPAGWADAFMTGVPATILSFPAILGHNLRAIVLILVLGLFSFGVLGVLLYLVNMVVIGAVLALFAAQGMSPWTIGLNGILPHGLFELTGVILSSAAIFYIGIALVTPRSHQTLGEVLIHASADWMKVSVGLVVPLLTLAAAIETWVTPVLLSNALH